MSLTLTREQEAKLQRKATRLGKPAAVVLDELLEEQEPQTLPANNMETIAEMLPEDEEYEEPHLVNENGFWAIAGGRPMSIEDVRRLHQR